MPLRSCFRARARAIVQRVDAGLPHRFRVTEYEGYELVYSRGNSLVERIEKQGAYEPETIGAIVETVGSSPHRTLVDVGANIGLVSLAVLAAVPDATVYAFEPGPLQHRLFAETIRRNRLDDRVRLSPLALSNERGRAEFAVHVDRHVAGDGLLDTGRAGRPRYITVETDTLDVWWDRSGCPPVDALKLDTEGSELWILQGGRSLVEHERPTVFLEIHDVNLAPYPYDAADVRAHLEGLGYALETFGSAEYVARPA